MSISISCPLWQHCATRTLSCTWWTQQARMSTASFQHSTQSTSTGDYFCIWHSKCFCICIHFFICICIGFSSTATLKHSTQWTLDIHGWLFICICICFILLFFCTCIWSLSVASCQHSMPSTFMGEMEWSLNLARITYFVISDTS